MDKYFTSWRVVLVLMFLPVVKLSYFSTHSLAQNVQEMALLVDDDAGQHDPQLQLLKQYAHVNCAFVRRVCVLSEAQEQQLLSINDAWIADAIKKATDPDPENDGVAAGFARLFGIARPAQARAPRAQQQPSLILKSVHQAIDKQIESVLEEDQIAQLKVETDARDLFRREAQARVVVSILDRRLFLTDDQRAALEPAIVTSLKKEIAWSFYLQNDNYIPVITPMVYAKVLDKDQMDALTQWRGVEVDAEQFELQLIDQQEQIMIEK